MRCVLCGGETEKKVIDEEIRVTNDHFLVKMELDVCKNCNEKYYTEGQVDTLIHFKKRFEKEKVGCLEVGKVYQISS
ncbi:MAG: YgiT-type zinc finger protein [Deltaproteobacteria bacterium]|nr:YgiT-type zinc finger protein [Deltaproteobacteria bacterium]